jgi:hypothetical protein
MTTATRTDLLADLAARDQKAARARAKARAAGEKVVETQHEVGALREELTRLYQDDPESFDHNGEPLKASSPAGKVVAELAKLDDLGELEARYKHAKQIEQRVEQSIRDFVAAH